jgi:hypothetical protein
VPRQLALNIYILCNRCILDGFLSEESPWEDLKHSDYRAILEEAKRQLRSIDVQIEGIQRISNVILIKKSQSEYYRVSDDLPLEMSVALMEIADGLKDGLMKVERTLTRLEARLDTLHDGEIKEQHR